MIPPFEDNGYLPPGIHPATLEEVEARFGCDSDLRGAQIQSLRWLVEIVRRAGIARVILNGSFVTDAIEPNDVDCALLVAADFREDSGAATELHEGLPFLDLEIVDESEFVFLVEELFATDRDTVPKGLVELIL
jgi:hypothetical protein